MLNRALYAIPKGATTSWPTTAKDHDRLIEAGFISRAATGSNCECGVAMRYLRPRALPVDTAEPRKFHFR